MNGEHGTEVAVHHSLAAPAQGVSFLCEDDAPDATCHHRVLLHMLRVGSARGEGTHRARLRGRL